MTALRLLLLAPWFAYAAEPADLPSTDQVGRALSAHPAVIAATAGIRVEEANRDRLGAGPHEFALRLAEQRRRERGTDLAYREHEVGIERAIRMPGKSAVDGELGDLGVEQARASRGEALHEGARLLLGQWFDWLRAGLEEREWQAHVDTLKTQHAAVTRRVAVGDAARLDGLLSEAQLVQADALLEQSRARRQRLAADLARSFPVIVLPEAVAPAEPRPLPESSAVWTERIIAANHELRAVNLATRRAGTAARRADSERLPDPTLGIKLASERDGQERIVGLQVSVPLGGTARSAAARAANAEADVAAAREATIRTKVEIEAHRAVGLAESALEAWWRLDQVARRMDDNAALLDKAWRLGEGRLTDLQAARRQAVEARLAASRAQLDANEARYRVLLDAHELWPIDADGHD